MDLKQFEKSPILGILRGIEEHMIDPLVEASLNARVQALEITMNTNNAPLLIKKMKDASRGKLMIGAGTVLSLEEMHLAIDAGATFIVMPVLVEEITSYCAKNNIPVFPGAYTPQEIYNAWNAGATMVKVFPAKFFGPGYLKEVKGPFSKIELLACGGVDKNNIGSFFSNGASAIAFGGSIFQKEWLKNQEYDKIENEMVALIKGYHNRE
ncbi:MAG: bifunctional 4-hydroxy-2-oxoglutarate aldolase/2-dehydro-3-deoxy-phosphogluconate aldolase [Bacteroidota bacterium]